jgi:hypothetical protein
VPFGQRSPDARVAFDQLDRPHDQVAEVQKAGRREFLLVGFVENGDVHDLLSARHRVGVAGGLGLVDHRVREAAIGLLVAYLVLGSRDGRQHVADVCGRVEEVSEMPKGQNRYQVFEQPHRVGLVGQSRIARQTEDVVEAPEDIQTEGMESADPHRGSMGWSGPRQAIDELAGGLIGERQDEDRPGVDTLVDEALYARDQRFRLPGSGAGLKLEGGACMRRGQLLAGIERGRRLRRARFGHGHRDREQQGVEQLLGDQRIG